MDKLKVAKKEHSLASVKHAKAGLELKVMEYEAEIERIKNNINIQDEEISKLEGELKGLREE